MRLRGFEQVQGFADVSNSKPWPPNFARGVGARRGLVVTLGAGERVGAPVRSATPPNRLRQATSALQGGQVEVAREVLLDEPLDRNVVASPSETSSRCLRRIAGSYVITSSSPTRSFLPARDSERAQDDPPAQGGTVLPEPRTEIKASGTTKTIRQAISTSFRKFGCRRSDMRGGWPKKPSPTERRHGSKRSRVLSPSAPSLHHQCDQVAASLARRRRSARPAAVAGGRAIFERLGTVGL